METKDLFPDEFFKQFKTGDDLQKFLKDLQKRGIEKLLEGELDALDVLTKIPVKENA